MTVLNFESVAGLAFAAGFRGEPGAIAVAVSKAESGFDTQNRLDNGPLGGHGIDRGLWQINDYFHPEVTDAVAYDPAGAAGEAYRISSGGASWKPWTTYNSGAYRKHLDEARTAFRSVEQRGGVPDAPATTPDDPASDRPTGRPAVALEPAGADFLGEVDPPTTVGRIRVRGSRLGVLGIASHVIGDSQVQLSALEEPDISLTFTDPGLALNQRGLFNVGGLVDVRDLRLKIAQKVTGPGDDENEQVTISCRSDPLQQLRTMPAPTMSNVGAGDYLIDLARRVGLTIGVLGPTNVRDQIAPEPVDPVPVPRTAAEALGVEDALTVLGRLADEEGFWLFVTGANRVYFDRPSSLVNSGTNFWVAWGLTGPCPDPPYGPGRGRQWQEFWPIDCPTVTRTLEVPDAPEVSIRLPRHRGELVRPGMRLNLAGGDGGNLVGGNPPGYTLGAYLVTRNTWPLDGGIEPCTIEAVTPADPTPTGDDPVGVVAGAGVASPNTKSALDFVAFCQAQVGDSYVWGAEAAPTDDDPDAFDCSELIQWALARVGVTFPDGSSNQMAAIRAAGLTRTIAECARTRGALLWHPGHIAVSLGDGSRTVEARGRAYGVVNYIVGTRFTDGGLVPGLSYGGTSTKATGAT